MAKSKWVKTKYPSIYKYELKIGNRYGIRLRYQDVSGTWKEKTESGFKTISAAKERKTDLESLINNDMSSTFEGNKTTFKVWYEKWFALSKPGWKGATIRNIDSAYRNYLSEFDNVILSKLSLAKYQEFINKQLQQDISLNSIRIRHRYMMLIMNAAVKHEIITKNKLNAVSIKKPTNDEIKDKIISDNNLKLLDRQAREKLNDTRYAMYLLMRIGWRTGEILGLPNKAVNIIDEETVDVSVLEAKTRSSASDSPKTKSSYRTNRLTGDYARAMIRAVKVAKEIRKALGVPDAEESKVFIKSNGKIYADSANRVLIDIISDGADQHIHPHMFRHTFSSNAIASGMSVVEVAKWLGHSKIDMTLNTYTHSVNNSHEKLIDFVNINSHEVPTKR